MNSKLIATIYFYLVSIGALILIVIGIFNIVNFTINSTQYDKYPLRFRDESCEMFPYSRGDFGTEPAIAPAPSTPSAQEQEKQKARCLADVEKERKETRLEDLKNAVTFPLIGVILFLIHFPQARKRSE